MHRLSPDVAVTTKPCADHPPAAPEGEPAVPTARPPGPTGRTVFMILKMHVHPHVLLQNHSHIHPHVLRCLPRLRPHAVSDGLPSGLRSPCWQGFLSGPGIVGG